MQDDEIKKTKADKNIVSTGGGDRGISTNDNATETKSEKERGVSTNPKVKDSYHLHEKNKKST